MKIISLLFHPFSFLLLGIFILFNTNTYINYSYPNQYKLIIYLILFVNTMVLPVVLTWYLYSKKHISSIKMDKVRDRKLIYFFTFLLYLITLFVLSGFNVPSYAYKYAFGATMTVGILFVFTLIKKKISAHLAGLGGMAGALTMLSIKLSTDFLVLICAMILFAGIVGTSRLKLNAHKENELYWGFLIGFLAQIYIFS